MSSAEDSGAIDSITRILQIIHAAMFAGVLLLIGVAVFVQMQSKPIAVVDANAKAEAPKPDSPPLITVLAFVMAGSLIPLSFFVPKLVTDATRKRIVNGTWFPPAPAPGKLQLDPKNVSDIGKLTSVYMTEKIIGTALNEGAAFFATVAYMVEGNPLALGLALALLGGILMRFPVRSKVEAWINAQLEKLVAERQFGS